MKSKFQRTVIGGMVMMFRKWMLRGTTKRWRGIDKKGALNDLEFENLFFSQESGNLEEGSYVSTLRFLNNYRKDLKNFNFNIMGKYNKLTDMEKSNIKRTLTDATIYSLMFGLYSLLSSMAEAEPDDETKELLYLIAYWFRRTQSEIGFWANPVEAFNIIRTPAASVSMLEKTGSFVYEVNPLTGWNEYERKTGIYEKGDLKLQKRTADLFPIYNQIFRYQNSRESLSYLVDK